MGKKRSGEGDPWEPGKLKPTEKEQTDINTEKGRAVCTFPQLLAFERNTESTETVKAVTSGRKCTVQPSSACCALGQLVVQPLAGYPGDCARLDAILGWGQLNTRVRAAVGWLHLRVPRVKTPVTG